MRFINQVADHSQVRFFFSKYSWFCNRKCKGSALQMKPEYITQNVNCVNHIWTIEHWMYCLCSEWIIISSLNFLLAVTFYGWFLRNNSFDFGSVFYFARITMENLNAWPFNCKAINDNTRTIGGFVWKKYSLLAEEGCKMKNGWGFPIWV